MKIIGRYAMTEPSEMQELYGVKVREPDGRQTDNPNGRAVDIKQLWSRQHEILNLDSLGYKGTEIAKMLGITPTTVSNALNSTLGTEEKSNIRKTRDEEFEELREEVMVLTKKSLIVYNEILDSETEAMTLKKATADTVALDLAGMRAPTRIDSRTVHTTATVEEIEGFKRRGIEAAKSMNQIVTVANEGKRSVA